MAKVEQADPVFQPVVWDGKGVIRFRANLLVRYLLDEASAGRKCDMNKLSIFAQQANVEERDMEQFAMLIGYSVSGFGDLSYVRPETLERADKASDKLARRSESKNRDREVMP